MTTTPTQSGKYASQAVEFHTCIRSLYSNTNFDYFIKFHIFFLSEKTREYAKKIDVASKILAADSSPLLAIPCAWASS